MDLQNCIYTSNWYTNIFYNVNLVHYTMDKGKIMEICIIATVIVLNILAVSIISDNTRTNIYLLRALLLLPPLAIIYAAILFVIIAIQGLWEFFVDLWRG